MNCIRSLHNVGVIQSLSQYHLLQMPLLPVSGIALDGPEAILFVVYLIPVRGDSPLIPFASNLEFYLRLWSWYGEFTENRLKCLLSAYRDGQCRLRPLTRPITELVARNPYYA